jgi:protocatechuate 3,4-dioxygenase beta subunit
MDHHAIVAQRTTQRPSRLASGTGSIAVCLAILIVVRPFPFARAGDGPSKPAAANPKAAGAPAPAAPALFDLRIVGPDDKPIADASVNVRSGPSLDKKCVKEGTFVAQTRFGIYIRSGADGRVIFERPSRLDYLWVTIRKPGYANYGDSWGGTARPMPATVTARLQAAWTIGGIVVDSNRKPVANARFTLMISFMGGAGGILSQSQESVWTNAQGMWKYESVPNSTSEVIAQISHPNFQALQTTLTHRAFAVAPGREPSAKITLTAGVTVTGKVTDQSGKPIANALVRTTSRMELRKTWTGADGAYRLDGCAPGLNKIVAWAKHHAPGLQEVQVDEGVDPVDFQLKPGNTIRIRVVDERGRPIPQARIAMRAGGAPGSLPVFALDQAPHETDDEGVWEWNEAPPDKLRASIASPDGMRLDRPVVARKDEYVFRVAPALVVSGKVLDGETKQPITTFRYRWGLRSNQQQLQWRRSATVEGESRYQIREQFEQPAYLVRIDAEGYLPAVSREIKADEGHVTIDFELLKGKMAVATVVTPEGAPAADAKVVLANLGPRVVAIGQGRVIAEVADHVESVREARTDQAGQFRLEATELQDNFSIVVTHKSGYAAVSGLPSSSPRVIKLAPWARIEGTFQVGRRPEPNVRISLNNPFVGNRPSDVRAAQQTTDSHGRFVFEQVVPGENRLTCQRTSGRGDSEVTASVAMTVACPAGQATHVEFGASGRPVIGQLQKPTDSNADIELSAAEINLYARRENGTMPASHLQFHVTPDCKGNFCIDDVPPGSYFLGVSFRGGAGFGIPARTLDVPEVNEKLAQRPVDLGMLTLTRASRPRVRAVPAPVVKEIK